VISRNTKKKINLAQQKKNSQQQISKKHSNSTNPETSITDSPEISPRSDSTSPVQQKKDHFSWPTDFDLAEEIKGKMPPNRKVNHNHGGGARAQQPQLANQYNPQRRNNNAPHNNGVYNKPLTCCVPTECFEPEKLIYVEDIGTRELEVMKVVCNNEHCDQGQFMHLDCFLVWEQALSKHVKSYGRARSWSEKQRLENIWTKKGYDLAFKACSCKCGRGHLRKDLDWIPPQRAAVNNNQNGNAAVGGNAAPANQAPDQNPQAGAQVVENPVQQANAGKKKKSKNREQRPKLAVSAPVHHPNNNNVNQYYYQGQQAGGYPKPGTSSGCHVPQSPCASGSRSNSIDYGLGTSVESSGTFSQSPPLSQGSQVTKCRSRMDSLSSNGSGSSGISEAVMANLARRGSSRKITERPIFTGDFATRENCSAFNILPLHKRTPFHVKVNDEVDSSEKASGVDATRMFLLSTLLRNKQSHVCCVLCEDYMTVYDRYPLLDGTFFLSPMPYLRDSIPVRDDLLIEKSRVMDGSKLFLNAVCMRCLEGWNKVLHCKFCNVKWDGSDYMLGTCYNYDIFADVCCPHRVLCKTCNNIVVHPGDRELYFSDYGNHFECPHCGIRDYHLVKEIDAVFHVYPPRCQY
jgi:hypothetical protein